MTNLLQFTVNIRKSHRQPQCTVELVSDDRVLFVGVDLARFFMRAASSKMRLNHFSRISTIFLMNFTFRPTPQTKI
jgi:hypothetical protein